MKGLSLRVQCSDRTYTRWLDLGFGNITYTALNASKSNSKD